MARSGLEQPAELAAERGVHRCLERRVHHREDGPRVRNATTTTIAPTGTISIIAGCSSGIEPLFAVWYVRANVLDDESMVEVHPYFEQVARERGFYSDELMKKIADVGSARHVDGIPADVQSVFATAHDITPECKYCDYRRGCLFDESLDAAKVRRVEELSNPEVMDRLRAEEAEGRELR